MLPTHYGHPVAPVTKRDWATLDLKDASDLLSLDLVRALFPDNWVEALEACRSGSTKLPNGRIVTMTKHAPMGSAVCFPVMALCIWSIVTNAIHLVSGTYEPVYVYGDDIIVPSEYRDIAQKALTVVGLKVNHAKSYSRGPFRESCGKEYVDGIDVTPVYVNVSPDDDAYSQLKTVAFYNNCYRKYSGPEVRSLLDYLVELYGPIPQMCGLESQAPSKEDYQSTSRKAFYLKDPLVGVVLVDSPNNSGIRRRWNSKLQRFEYRVRRVCPLVKKYQTDAWCHVLRSLVQPKGSELGVDALAKRTRIKYSWSWLGGLNPPLNQVRE
jgi:hypothetical protein